MAFRVKCQEGIAHSAKRLVLKELTAALRELNADDHGQDVMVHSFRKRMKKIRAVLRFVRFGLAEDVYRQENVSFRDIGRRFAEIRDAKVVLDAFDRLTKQSPQEMMDRDLNAFRTALESQIQTVRESALAKPDPFEQARDAVRVAKHRVRDWHISKVGWSIVGRGFRRVYRTGLRALDTAEAQPSPEHLHEWRKQAKYLRHLIEILEPVRPRTLKKLGNQLHELADRLGDYRDLSLLRSRVLGLLSHTADTSAGKILVRQIDRRLHELREAAFIAGRHLYRLRPKVMASRMKAWWKEWSLDCAVPSHD